MASQVVEDGLRRSRAALLPSEPRCAEPLDLQDVPLLGYDGAPSTQRHRSAPPKRSASSGRR